jgi:hypothetical protein
MGCDIHTYIEYAELNPQGGESYWKNFTRDGGSRDYEMFGVLAGVRVEEAKLFDPKGMPAGPLGYQTSHDYWVQVAPEAHPEWADGDGWASLERATQWVDNGSSIGETDKSGRLHRVTGPDWHSHSWLTADELSQVLDHYLKLPVTYWPNREIPAEWVASLAAMRAFIDGWNARLDYTDFDTARHYWLLDSVTHVGDSALPPLPTVSV